MFWQFYHTAFEQAGDGANARLSGRRIHITRINRALASSVAMAALGLKAASLAMLV